MAPLGLLHPLPFAECVQAEVQQPLRLLLLRGNEPYDVLVKSLGHILLLDLRDEAFLILPGRKISDCFYYIVHTRAKIKSILLFSKEPP